nr:MAG TPA: hypothetical protein [Caudoviricetes sp.]
MKLADDVCSVDNSPSPHLNFKRNFFLYSIF